MVESHGNFSVRVAEVGERDLLHRADSGMAYYLHREGRISNKELHAWKLANRWCAMRFTGDAGWAQDRFATRCGMEALWSRRERALKLWARFCGVSK